MAAKSTQQNNPKVGIGGAPTRATTLPEDGKERKKFPIATGVLDYFPDALVAVAEISYAGNQQHNPGKPLHWDRSKSQDEDDTLIRHFLQRGSLDTDGKRHSAKVAWRSLAMLQKEIEASRSQAPLTGNAPVNTITTANESVEEIVAKSTLYYGQGI